MLNINNLIKDSNGTVKTLYHGTPNAGFTEFSEEYFGIRTNHNREDVGFHFTDDPEYANTYAKTIEIKMELTYQKVFGEASNIYKSLPHSAIIPVYLEIKNPLKLEKSRYINKTSIEYAKNNGHDGIIANHGNGLEYVVFNSKQIHFKYRTNLN